MRAVPSARRPGLSWRNGLASQAIPLRSQHRGPPSSTHGSDRQTYAATSHDGLPERWSRSTSSDVRPLRATRTGGPAPHGSAAPFQSLEKAARTQFLAFASRRRIELPATNRSISERSDGRIASSTGFLGAARSSRSNFSSPPGASLTATTSGSYPWRSTRT